ncbi:hypothetical protein MKW98_008441, partial [Papaver atlanticum]
VLRCSAYKNHFISISKRDFGSQHGITKDKKLKEDEVEFIIWIMDNLRYTSISLWKFFLVGNDSVGIHSRLISERKTIIWQDAESLKWLVKYVAHLARHTKDVKQMGSCSVVVYPKEKMISKKYSYGRTV